MGSTRGRILQTAVAVFAERGTDGGSMREIAKRAGVNVATAYHHFGSKRDLVLAIFRELGFVDAPDGWDFEPLGDLDPAERLAQIMVGAWALMGVGAEVVRIAVLEALKGDEDVQSVFATWRDQGQRRLEDVLVRTGLASESQAPSRALAVRRTLWGIFVEHLMYGPFDLEVLAAGAREAAGSLVEAWS